MNLETSIARQGIAAQQQVAGWTFKLLSDGSTFPGRIDPQPSIDPRLSLGSDPREVSVIYLLQEDYPPALDQEDRLSQLDENGAEVGVWRVLNRDNNTADVEIKLWVCKVTPQDQ